MSRVQWTGLRLLLSILRHWNFTQILHVWCQQPVHRALLAISIGIFSWLGPKHKPQGFREAPYLFFPAYHTAPLNKDKRFPYVIGMLFVIFNLMAARICARWRPALTRELQEVTFLTVIPALWHSWCPYMVPWMPVLVPICEHLFVTAHGNTMPV